MSVTSITATTVTLCLLRSFSARAGILGFRSLVEAFVAPASIGGKPHRAAHAFGARSTPFVTSIRSVARWLEEAGRDHYGGAAVGSVSSELASATAPATDVKPPPARREEDRVVLAGRLPDEGSCKNEGVEEKKALLRQSESSPNDLLNPAVPILDPYGWMRSDKRDNREVNLHLHAENAYTEALTAHLEGLREDLYSEFLCSVKETDYTVPSKCGPFLYYTRTFEGKSYISSCRAPCPENGDWKVEWDGSRESPILFGEEVYLDTNALAEGRAYCTTGQIRVSPSHDLIAYTVDFSGNETCELHVKNIASGEVVDHDEELECDGTILWGNDDSTLFYVKLDDTHRPYQVYRRKIGDARVEGGRDELLFEEDDKLYWVRAWKSFCRKYLFVSAKSKETAEIHFLDLTDPDAKLQCIAHRRPKVLYSVTHREDKWLITTNVGGTPNMRLMTCPAVADSEDLWEDAVDEDGNKMFDGGFERSLDGVTPFSSHMVACGREGGIPRVWVASFGSDEVNEVKDFVRLTFDETAYDVRTGRNLEYDTGQVVLEYDSLVTPLQSIRVDMSNVTKRTVLKEMEVPGYDKSLFACTSVLSRDGKAAIPVSIVYRKDIMKSVQSGELPAGAHAHLYGYGSYGACIEASFRATRLPLLDRGMIYVIAHVRGGGEMGRQWYEEPDGAKYLCKKNTFNDFVDVARWLVNDRNITVPDRLSCEGRSAGGLLIGASVNQAPDLFKAAILGVPFVDVVCTMTDASIPLTVVEWEEWGNPNEKKFHDYMIEYSPINNVKAGASYPACLLTGGLHDPRVQYWEPVKFAAELRHSQGPESGPVCVKIDMSAGHFSASDRYKYLKELAFDYAFLLDQMELTAMPKD